jgi:hypothetical protein
LPHPQVILLAPNLVLPVEALAQALSIPTYADPQLLPSSGPMMSGCSTTAEQASQLLAAHRAPSPTPAPPAMGLFGPGPLTPG